MQKIIRFDKDVIMKIMNDVNEALKKIGNNYGISFTKNKVKFSTDLFRTKLECVVNKNGLDTKKILWDRYCGLFNLSPDDYGRKFTFGEKIYTVVGIKPNSRRYNIVAVEEESGKEFKFPVDIIRDAQHGIWFRN